MTSKLRSRTRRARWVLLAVVLACVLGGGVLELEVTSTQARSGFSGARDRLQADLDSAQLAGYSSAEVAPVPASAERLEQVDPIWISGQPGYYDARTTSLNALDSQLHGLEQTALATRRSLITAEVQSAAAGVSQATQLGADPLDLVALHRQLAQAEDAQAAATEPRQLAAVLKAVRSVKEAATTLSRAQAADQASIQAAAASLQGIDAGKLKAQAQGALAAGRNDATVAAYLQIQAVTRPYDQLERYATQLVAAGSDPAQLAMATAGLQHYQSAIHAALVARLPHQVVIVSHSGQSLAAYDAGNLVRNTLITSGRPQLPTDLGVMKVLSKSSPFTMRSPWPKSSPWYYPPTKVQMVVWFTVTGEGLHDAYWEPNWAYGPGSDSGGFASHGCIHLQLDDEKWLYGWSKIGMPVVVYPGDGTPVVNQVAQISVDANGDPTTGPKGV